MNESAHADVGCSQQNAFSVKADAKKNAVKEQGWMADIQTTKSIKGAAAPQDSRRRCSKK